MSFFVRDIKSRIAIKAIGSSEPSTDTIPSDLKDELELKKTTLKTYFNSLEDIYAGSVINLTNANFTTGTYIIDTPGLYRLSEDIVFNPNSVEFLNSNETAAVNLRSDNSLTLPVSSYDSGGVLSSQFATYDPKAFGLGFFTAISVVCKDVIIDLNDMIIRQSKEHTIQQKVFSLIELSDQPFIPKQGPHNFGDTLNSARNCYIKNGKLGLNSHHGIHGNENRNILLEDLTFFDYEIAAVSLNKVNGLYVDNCKVERNRQDIPTLGILSAAKFLKPYVEKLYTDSWDGTIGEEGVNEKDITTIRNELKTSIENVFQHIVVDNDWETSTSTDEYKLFGNPGGLIDGNSYGFLINSGGAAVLGFPDGRPSPSKYIHFKNVRVSNQSASIREVAAIDNGSGDRQNDIRGAVLQMWNKDKDGGYVTLNNDLSYKGNVVSNAQLAVAKAIHAGFDFGTLNIKVNSISQDIVDWANGSASSLNDVAGIKFIGNGDAMFHVNKGVISYKMDASENIYMENCDAYKISNKGKLGLILANDNISYKNRMGKSHPEATYLGYGGADVRGFSFSSSKNIVANKCSARKLVSDYGFVYAFDVHRYSRDIILSVCESGEIYAGNEVLSMDEYDNNPTHLPIAVGIHIEKNSELFDITNSSASQLTSPYLSYRCLLENI